MRRVNNHITVAVLLQTVYLTVDHGSNHDFVLNDPCTLSCADICFLITDTD